MKIVTFLWKNGYHPKRVVDFPLARDTFRNKIMEIVEDFDDKSYNNNGKPLRSSRILRVNPNFFIFLSVFIMFLHFFVFFFFFILSFSSFFSIFSFFPFFSFFSFFSFSPFFIFFQFFIFLHFLSSSFIVFHFLSFSFIFFHFHFFFFCRGLKILFFSGSQFRYDFS